MATYIRSLNAIYLAAPGTGSTSIERMLLDQTDGEYIDGKSSAFKYGVRHALPDELAKAQAAGLLTSASDVDFANAIYLTSVRNPFAYHAASWHRNRTKWIDLLTDRDSWIFDQPGKLEEIVRSVKMDFSTWVLWQLEPLRQSGKSVHLNAPYVRAAQYFVRMEHLLEDLNDTLRTLGFLGEITEYKLNITEKKDGDGEYWKFYNQIARDCVQEVHQPTIDKFGYAF